MLQVKYSPETQRSNAFLGGTEIFNPVSLRSGIVSPSHEAQPIPPTLRCLSSGPSGSQVPNWSLPSMSDTVCIVAPSIPHIQDHLWQDRSGRPRERNYQAKDQSSSSTLCQLADCAHLQPL